MRGVKLLRELAALIRSMPLFYERRFVAWAHRVALAPHLPQDIGDGSAWCLRERVPWPCDEWVRLTESYQKQRSRG